MGKAPSTVAARPVLLPAAGSVFQPKRVAAFFLLAYGISWAWVIPWAATGHTVREGRGWPTHFRSLLGPLLAALAVTAATTGRAGVRDLFVRMGRWRIGWRWWLVVGGGPLAFFFAVLGAMDAVGGDVPARGDFARFSGVPAGLGLVGVALASSSSTGSGRRRAGAATRCRSSSAATGRSPPA